MQVYLMNLGTGEGAWLPLPVKDKTEVKAFIEHRRISTPTDEEYIIADFDGDGELDLRIGEFDDVYSINELLNHYEMLDRYEQHKVLALLEANGNDISDFDNALSSYEDFSLLEDIHTQYELGECIIADKLYDLKDKLPLFLFHYIDFEAVGRDSVYRGDVALTTYGALY